MSVREVPVRRYSSMTSVYSSNVLIVDAYDYQYRLTLTMITVGMIKDPKEWDD